MKPKSGAPVLAAVVAVLALTPAASASAASLRVGATVVPAAKLLPADAGGPARAPAPIGPTAPIPVAQAEEVLDQAQAALAGAADAPEITPALLEVAQVLPGLDGRRLARAQRLLARPTHGADELGGYSGRARAVSTRHFCVFWSGGEDAPAPGDGDGDRVPDVVESTASYAEFSYKRQHGPLGWRRPLSDGKRGCRAPDGKPRIDIYLADLDGVYGYAVPEGGGDRNAGSLLIDSDMAEVSASLFPALAVTTAHEYNHVVQFGYGFQDGWMVESTATAIEELVFPGVDDYHNYLSTLATSVEIPLTFDDDKSTKIYGSSVFNLFLASRHGVRVLPAAWAQTLRTRPAGFAVKAYNRGIWRRSRGRSNFVREFIRFSASLPEWQTSGVYADGAEFPEVERSGTLVAGEPDQEFVMDHTTYGLLDVPIPAGDTLRLVAQAPPGIQSGIALVARRSDGGVVSSIRFMKRGGPGSVELADPGAYERITAVLVNAHSRIRGWNDKENDWAYRGDNRLYRAQILVE